MPLNTRNPSFATILCHGPCHDPGWLSVGQDAERDLAVVTNSCWYELPCGMLRGCQCSCGAHSVEVFLGHLLAYGEGVVDEGCEEREVSEVPGRVAAELACCGLGADRGQQGLVGAPPLFGFRGSRRPLGALECLGPARHFDGPTGACRREVGPGSQSVRCEYVDLY